MVAIFEGMYNAKAAEYNIPQGIKCCQLLLNVYINGGRILMNTLARMIFLLPRLSENIPLGTLSNVPAIPVMDTTKLISRTVAPRL